jgi:hypothetical protein
MLRRTKDGINVQRELALDKREGAYIHIVHWMIRIGRPRRYGHG